MHGGSTTSPGISEDTTSSSSSSGSSPLDVAYQRSRDAFFLNPSALLASVGSGVTSALNKLTGGGVDADRIVEPPRIVAAVGARASFPLRLQKANSYVRRHVALIGDAAHTVHPLAGQGLNLGIGDADALAAVLSGAASRGGDVGSLSALSEYERVRRSHNAAMMAAMDGVKRLFQPTVGGVPMEPIIQARNIGMALLNKMGPVKGQIAKLAMGNL